MPRSIETPGLATINAPANPTATAMMRLAFSLSLRNKAESRFRMLTGEDMAKNASEAALFGMSGATTHLSA